MQEIVVSNDDDTITVFNNLAKNPTSFVMVEIGTIKKGQNVRRWLGMVIKYNDKFMLNENAFDENYLLVTSRTYGNQENVTIADLLVHINECQSDLENRYCRFFLIDNLLELRDFLVEKI